MKKATTLVRVYIHTVLLEKIKNNKKVENTTLLDKSGVILSSQKCENKINNIEIEDSLKRSA